MAHQHIKGSATNVLSKSNYVEETSRKTKNNS